MKSIKILIAASLLITMPSNAIAQSSSSAADGNEKCFFLFPTSWYAYMFIPCHAGWFRRT